MSSDVSGVCLQRKKQMLFTIPPIRLETSSPYQNYTKFQLDMRRKAEVLQYTGNSQASKGNNLTKKQQMAQILSGKYQNSTYPGTIVQNVTEVHNSLYDISENSYSYETIYSNIDTNCNNNETIYTSTRSSGVPGPPMLLYKDDSVPLYNYKTKTEASAIVTDEDTDEWRYHITENISVLHNTSVNIFSMAIQYGIKSPQNTYNFSIPYGMFVRGTSKVNIHPGYSLTVSLSTTTPFNISVLYNDSNVTDPNTGSALELNTIYTDSSFNIDISGSNVNPNNNNNNNIDISGGNIQKKLRKTFEAYSYGGTIKVSNMNLYTERGFVYDIISVPKVSLTAPLGFTDYFENIEYGIVFNTKPFPLYTNKNCTIVDKPYPPYRPFDLNGNEIV